MSPQYVRPYVKAHKNDDRDAEAIAEAATRPTMQFVELKTEEQLDMQTLHRIRDQLVGDRTSLMGQIRSLLLERGHIMPQGRAKLAVRLSEMLDGDALVLGLRIHKLVTDMRLRWTALDQRITDLNAEFTDTSRTDECTRRLLTIPIWARSMRPRSWQRSVMPGPLGVVATLPPGSDWFRGRQPPGASRGCSVSPNGEADICASI